MKRLLKAILVFGFTAVVGVSSLFAQIIPNIGTLADLANGGTIGIGDKIFSGFSYQSSGLTSFDASQITVTASESGGVDYLTWSGNMSFVSGGTATADLSLNYTVTANPGLISMIDQRYIGSVNNGVLSIDETATSGAPTAHSHLSVGDLSDPNTYPSGPFDVGENDLLVITPPQSVLSVTKDISFGVIAPTGGTGSVAITLVEQSFHQVPEPSTMLLAGLGG